MISSETQTVLERLSKSLSIDADTMESDFIASLPITPHDMTSNPRFVHERMAAPDSRELVCKIIAQDKTASFEDIYAKAVGQLSAKVIPHISGRVLAQVLPSQSYNKDEIVAQARRYRDGYAAAGIDAQRFCVKIPLTGAGIAAAVELRKEGIATLGTCLMSVEQAVAASQAGMHAVSMYFNEPLAGSDAKVWPDVSDPSSEHPMACRHIRMRMAYNKIRDQTGKCPQVKTAAFVSAREVAAMIALGADHVTLGKPTLEDLCAGPGLPRYKKGLWKVPITQQMQGAGFEWEAWEIPPTPVSDKMAQVAVSDINTDNKDQKGWMEKVLGVDWLEAGVLDQFNETDRITKQRLPLALERFGAFETESRNYIESLRKELA